MSWPSPYVTVSVGQHVKGVERGDSIALVTIRCQMRVHLGQILRRLKFGVDAAEPSRAQKLLRASKSIELVPLQIELEQVDTVDAELPDNRIDGRCLDFCVAVL